MSALTLPPRRFRVVRHLVNDNEESYLDIAFPKAAGGEGRLIVRRGLLLETNKARVLFADHGAALPDDCPSLFNDLLNQPAVVVTITTKTGWRGDCYLTRFGLISVGGQNVELDTASGRLWARHERGTAGEYFAQVAPLLAASPFLLFAYILALAAPLAARIGMSTGFAVCLAAESSTGKTSCLRLAQSLVTRAEEADLEPFGHTTGILLDALPYFGGQTVSFGDLKAELSTKAAAEKLRTLVFAATGGAVRLRKGEPERPKPDFNILLLSAERPMHEMFAANGLAYED
ncbi:MAG TPA: DUF927 domain-containing protein, partial [Tianweitania sediminis]|nr:DUF927 domain-containing protein [Tianweitania sediminis]